MKKKEFNRIRYTKSALVNWLNYLIDESKHVDAMSQAEIKVRQSWIKVLKHAILYYNDYEKYLSGGSDIKEVGLDEASLLFSEERERLKLAASSKRSKVFRFCVKVICFLFLSTLLYLFALNGRYHSIGSGDFLDKWKKEVIRAGSKELPFVYNGDKHEGESN